MNSVCKNKLHMCAKDGSRLFYRDCASCMYILHIFPNLVGFKPSSGSVEHFVLLLTLMSVKSNSLYFSKSYWLPDF